MPTRRMIDPSFWQSESMAELSEPERLFFIGLISNADDQGRIRGHPALLRSTIYPFDEISTETIEARIEALSSVNCIFVYESVGKKSIQIIKWWDYQSPQWAYPSKMDPPAGWSDRLRYRAENKVWEDNWNGPGGFPEGYFDDYANLGKGLDNQIPKPLPKDQGKPIEIGLEVDLDSDNNDKRAREKISEISTLYQNNIGGVSPIMAQEMTSPEYLKLPLEWWQEAIKIAVDNDVRKWTYIRSILDRSGAAGLSPVALGPPQAQKKGQQKGHSNGHKPKGQQQKTTDYSDAFDLAEKNAGARRYVE